MSGEEARLPFRRVEPARLRPRVLLPLTPEQWNIATVIGGLRQHGALGAHSPDSYGSKDVHPFVHSDGAASELGISLDVNRGWTGTTRKRSDQPDVGRRIEVRATRYRTGRLAVHERKRDPDDALCVLVIVEPAKKSYEVPTMYAVGWTRAGIARQDRWRERNKDGTYVWMVPQSALEDYDAALLRQLDDAP